MKGQLDLLELNNMVSKSSKPFKYLSRAFLIKKPGEDKWRLVVDYRELNDITIKDSYPIPNMNEVVRRWLSSF